MVPRCLSTESLAWGTMGQPPAPQAALEEVSQVPQLSCPHHCPVASDPHPAQTPALKPGPLKQPMLPSPAPGSTHSTWRTGAVEPTASRPGLAAAHCGTWGGSRRHTLLSVPVQLPPFSLGIHFIPALPLLPLHFELEDCGPQKPWVREALARKTLPTQVQRA